MVFSVYPPGGETRSVSSTTSLPWRRLLIPTEHGSWALTFEPVVLGLLVTTLSFSGWVAASVAAGFLARKPAKLAWGPMSAKSPPVRRAARVLAILFGSAAAFAIVEAAIQVGLRPLLPLALALPGVAYFAWCDRTGRTRTLSAEIVGTTVCALPLMTMALASAWSIMMAVALGAVALTRSLPTLFLVRTCLQRSRGQPSSSLAPLLAHLLGLAALATFAAEQWLPWWSVAVNSLLLLRGVAYLRPSQTPFSARQLGMIETAIGVVYLTLQAGAFR